MKTDINKILKPGATLEVKIIDYSTPKNKKRLKELRKECERIEANKNVDWDRLSRFYITI